MQFHCVARWLCFLTSLRVIALPENPRFYEFQESVRLSSCSRGRCRLIPYRLVNAVFRGIEDCNTCLEIAEWTYDLLDLNYGLADVRDLAIEQCERVRKGRVDIMCPAWVDAYGPHFERVFRSGRLEAKFVCSLTNHCEWKDDTHRYFDSNVRHIDHEDNHPRRFEKLDGNPNFVKVIHLTDIHIDEKYREGSVTDCGFTICCRPNYQGEGSASHYGDFHCNIPPRSIQLVLDWIKTNHSDASMVLYTGDNGPHTQWEETQDSQLDANRAVANLFAASLTGIPVYPSVGNHDTNPSNMYYTKLPDIEEFNTEFARIWGSMADFDASQIEDIHHGAYYTKKTNVDRLHVLAYNSLYGYVANIYNLLNFNSSEERRMKKFMEDTLNKVREANEKVILIGHIPFGLDDTLVPYSRFMADLCTQFSDVIAMHLQGHIHQDTFRVHTNSQTGEATGVQLIAPPFVTLGPSNPSARVLYLEKKTLKLVDYEQYFFNVSQEGETVPEMILGYRATEEYGMADLSPRSWQTLANKFELNSALFEKFLKNHRSQMIHPPHCDGTCRRQTLCAMRHSYVQDYEQCLRQESRVSNSAPDTNSHQICVWITLICVLVTNL